MPLHKELRNWLESLIKQRSYLIKSGKSKKNAYQMAEAIESLKKRLDYFPYNTDRKISFLFQQNREMIRELIPGEGSSGYQKRIDEFNHFDNTTKSILYGQDIHHRRHPSPGSKVQSFIPETGRIGIQA